MWFGGRDESPSHERWPGQEARGEQVKRSTWASCRSLQGPSYEGHKDDVSESHKDCKVSENHKDCVSEGYRGMVQRVTGAWVEWSQGHCSEGQRAWVRRRHRTWFSWTQGDGLEGQKDRRTWFGGSQGHGSDGHKGIGQRVKGEVFKITT